MSNLTRTDLIERLKSAACCSAELGDKAAKEKSYGLKCYKDTLRDLKLLNTYIEILCEYYSLESTLIEVAQITLSGGPFSGGVDLYIEGQLVFSKSYTTATIDTIGDDLANWINNIHTNPEYTATYTSSTSILKIYRQQTDTTTQYSINASYTLLAGSLGFGVSQSFPYTETDEELTDGNQCITEEKAQTLFEKITYICNTCYKTIGATYP